MTYELPGFNPASPHDNPNLPFSVWHNTINHIDVHVVHPQEIYRRIEAGQQITLVDYDNSAGRGNIRRIDATVKGGKNYSNLPAALYSATIALRKEKE